MSTFSLIAQDTGRSCMIKQSNLHHTYYLHDNKGNSWCEPAYTGNGIFGGKNFFVLCAQMNIESSLNLTLDQLQSIGMELYMTGIEIKYPNITETDDWSLYYNEKARPWQCPYGGYLDIYLDQNIQNIQNLQNIQYSPNFVTCIKYLEKRFVSTETITNHHNIINILNHISNEDITISQPYTHFDNSIDFEFLHKLINSSKPLESVNSNHIEFNNILKEILYTMNIQLTSTYIHPNVVDFCCGILNILEPHAYESYDDDDNKKLTRNVIKLCNSNNCSIQSMDDINVIEPNLEFLSYFYDHEHDYCDFIHAYKIMKNKYNIHIVNQYEYDITSITENNTKSHIALQISMEL